MRETATPEIARLVEATEFQKAASLAREALAVLPKDPTLENLWMRMTDEVAIDSEPPGADVAVQPYRDGARPWEALGKTPLEKGRVPKDDYIVRITKPGFAPVFVIDGDALYSGEYRLQWAFKLRPEESVPPEMVIVPGGEARLGAPFVAPPVVLDDYLIDRHEVTNEEYKKFVDTGGYRRREFWKEPFIRDGRELPWEEAMAVFVDTTGRPGPATWEVGSYPKGKEKHPVAGVSWYEAAAYAEFAGKILPTAYHWTWASQAKSFPALIASGSNLQGEGTRPVGSPGGLSGFGTMDGFDHGRRDDRRDHRIMYSKDLSRTLDYLETREDIDITKVAYLGASMGAGLGPLFLAVERRLQVAILGSGGLWLREELPEVDTIHFAPRVKAPVLMLNDRYDDYFLLEASQLPLYRLLGTPEKDKRHVVYDTGHGGLPDREVIRETLDWLDKYLGPVRRN